MSTMSDEGNMASESGEYSDQCDESKETRQRIQRANLGDSARE